MRGAIPSFCHGRRQIQSKNCRSNIGFFERVATLPGQPKVDERDDKAISADNFPNNHIFLARACRGRIGYYQMN